MLNQPVGYRLMWTGLFLIVAFTYVLDALGSTASKGVFILVGAIVWLIGLVLYWIGK